MLSKPSVIESIACSCQCESEGGGQESASQVFRSLHQSCVLFVARSWYYETRIWMTEGIFSEIVCLRFADTSVLDDGGIVVDSSLCGFADG